MALHLIIPTLILVIGVGNDLKSRKVRNYLILIFIFCSIANTFYFSGVDGLKMGGISLLVALGCCLPLVLPKIMGAGDMKLLMAFAINVAPMSTFYVFMYSFIWGALLGLLQALLKGQGMSLFHNTIAIVTSGKKAVSPEKLHKIPYTVALLFGWLTQLTLTGFRG
ncbi:MAG: prepilin peptidase [Bdellovibrionales bacterium]|nr:prepilin peptidase [Bdellovibrionales bacterium]